MLIGLLYACRETINKPTGVSGTPAVIESTTPEVKNVNIEAAKKMIASQKELILLDVRTPEETSEGMISGAIEIDYLSDNFEAEIVKLSKDSEYLVYCRSGNRSLQASEYMIRSGFKHVYNMTGGYTDWKQ